MRRNRITIIKCLLFICGFASVPILFKWLFLPEPYEGRPCYLCLHLTNIIIFQYKIYVIDNSPGNLPRFIANKQEWRRSERSLGKRLFWFELDDNGHPLDQSKLPEEKAIPEYIRKQVLFLFIFVFIF